MDNVKSIVAKNLVLLRKANNLTQSAVANELNYSDKSVSKWERGEALPDLETLVRLASFYGVTLDFLIDPDMEKSFTKKTDTEEMAKKQEQKKLTTNRIIISSIAVVSAYLVATLIFIYGNVTGSDAISWRAFIFAIPVSCFALILFFFKWKADHVYFLVTQSVFFWSLILSVYLQLQNYSFWYFFLAGVPIEALLILNHMLRTR